MKKIQVVILAGGEGQRLRPYTTVLPKPLMPVDDMPILEIIIRQLQSCQLKNIVISTGYLSELIRAYFGNGTKWGVSIKYVNEKKPLGTAGALKNIRNLAEHVLVINGDVLTNLKFDKLVSFHKKSKAYATVTVTKRIVKTDYGVITASRSGDLEDYIEKPSYESFVSTGIYALHKSAIFYIKAGEFLGMPDLLLRIKNDTNKVCCFKPKMSWFDLGRMDDFAVAQDVYKKNRSKFLH